MMSLKMKQTAISPERRFLVHICHQFLDALDRNDVDTLQHLAPILRDCADIMPNEACDNLGVPRGSTFARGVRVLAGDQRYQS